MGLTSFALVLFVATTPASHPATLEALVQSASSSVVAIDVERTKDLPPSLFQPQRISPQGRTAFQRPSGPVSGILLDAEGHVLTSWYNVAGEVKSIRVTLSNGVSGSARLLGKSPQDDAALLKLEGDHGKLPSELLPLGGTDGDEEPRAGQIVLVLGRSPDPGRLTATRGIVSAPARNGGRAIQTDAELNYGNSGGPIVGLDGRIVAMAGFVGHTQPQWGLNSGVGFGVTAKAIQEILPRLKAGEDVSAFRPGFLGIQCDRETGADLGAKVIKVVPEGGAAKAGVVKGDVIEQIDGVAVYDFDHLRRIIFARKPGDKVQLKIRRDKDGLELEAVLGAMVSP